MTNTRALANMIMMLLCFCVFLFASAVLSRYESVMGHGHVSRLEDLLK